MEATITGVLSEVEAQLDCIIDEACDAVDRVGQLEAENQFLREKAAAVVQEFEDQWDGTHSRLSAFVRELDLALIHGDESTADGDTLKAGAWPPPVGSAVTYIDDDGVTWPRCTVRAHRAKGWSKGRIRLDNGAVDSGDIKDNGATMSAWATEAEVRCG